MKQGEGVHSLPEILPGGEAALFGNVADVSRIALVSLKTGKRRNLTEGTLPRYLPTGHLVFARGGAILAEPFDLERLELTGPAASLLDGVMSLAPFNTPLIAFSSNGTLAYAPGSPPLHSLVWVDRRGALTPVAPEPGAYQEPRLSPDGRRLAVTIRDENTDVWIQEISRGTLARLTFETGEDETYQCLLAFAGNLARHRKSRELRPLPYLHSIFWFSAVKRDFGAKHRPGTQELKKYRAYQGYRYS